MSNESNAKNETQNEKKETQNDEPMNTADENQDNIHPANSGDDSKRPAGSRALTLIKAALRMLRGRNGGGKPPTSTNSNVSTFTKLVGCVRPLRLQDGGIVGSVPQPEEPGMISRYASAQSLCDLDDGGHVNDNTNGRATNAEVFYDGVQEDDKIDAKADLFIAQFYQQMKIDDQQKTD